MSYVTKHTLAAALIGGAAIAAGASLSAAAAGSASGRGASAPHAYLTSVSFANRFDGWVAGYYRTHGYVYRTRNAGRSWSRLKVGWKAQQMQFINGHDGWAVVASPPNCDPGQCRYAIVETHNGGSSWILQLNGGRCWQIQSMDFITNLEGWAIESDSACALGNQPTKTRVVGTTNGGSSWQVAFQPSGTRLTTIHFGAPLNGWAAGDGLAGVSSPHCRTRVYDRSPRGQAWVTQFSVNGYCYPFVDFVNARFGWVLMSNVAACAEYGCIDNRLYRTTNGGNSWTIEKRRWSGGGCGFLKEPHFVSSTVGYIPVSKGAGSCTHGGVDITRDGGHTWTRQIPYGFAMADLSPVSPTEVWAIACSQQRDECSHLVHTTNTGQSWASLGLG